MAIVINHGTDANTPRPDVAGFVSWIGPVIPRNAHPGDFHFRY